MKLLFVQPKALVQLTLAKGKRKLVRLLLVHPVVLSRVRTLAGIFLEKLIPDDIDFSPNPDDLEMMERGFD